MAIMEIAAARRVPEFARKYLQGGIRDRPRPVKTRKAWDAIDLLPEHLSNPDASEDPTCTIMGNTAIESLEYLAPARADAWFRLYMVHHGPPHALEILKPELAEMRWKTGCDTVSDPPDKPE